MEVVTLSDLAPILAAVVGPMLAVMFAMMRYQHADSVKTRNLMHELIDKSNRENRDLIDKSNQETRDLIDKSNQETRELIRENRDLIDKSNQETRELIRENRDLIEKNHSELSGSLGEVRERLSYIEGYLRQSPPPADDEDAQAA